MCEAEKICQALGGRWRARSGLAFCPAHDNQRTPALSVGQGDDDRLLLHCFAGCSFTEIVGALRQRGLISEIGERCDPSRPTRSKNFEAERQERDKRTANQARQIWRAADDPRGTMVEAYLRSRGISAEVPPSIRFLPNTWHVTAKRLPAMIARLDGVRDFAVHRTYLQSPGQKANVEPIKALLGSAKGGYVRLNSSGADTLVACEGIETGLSLLSGLFDEPAEIWAALTTSGMKGLRLPSQPRRLLVAHDGDTSGLRAAEALAHRAHKAGWETGFLSPPLGQDFNDVLVNLGVEQ